jgi:hypothetical protein
MGLFVSVLALVLVIFMWLVGDQELRTKVILTLVYVGLWVLFFLDPTGGWLVLAGEAIFCVVVWYGTFGGSIGRR